MAIETESSPIFSLRGVSQSRGDATILRDLTLDVPHTAITALVGPSGAGKTSLLRLLNRLDDPTAGTVSFSGRAITDYAVTALRRRVGFVFQTPVMFPGTVADNLRVAVELGGVAAASEAPSFERVLAAVELSADHAARDAASLSGGEKQRVNLARTLMTNPEVLLLDEPTSALDPEVADRLLATIAKLPERHSVSVVMVTHRLGEAREISTHTIMLEGGQLVEAGPTAQLFSSATTARARAYFASAD